jgi:hypothetical protein
MRKPGSENSPYDPPYDFKNSEIDICMRIFHFAQVDNRFEDLKIINQGTGVLNLVQSKAGVHLCCV